MDPLTHTLVGANLAASPLGRTTRYAAAALVIGANLPDVDVASYWAGAEAALAFRRGWTHGLPALVLWPFVLTGLLMAWGRLRRHADGPPLRPVRLAALSALALLTHPALDWLNNYGMRWWLPFDGRWSYGDAVFIMDPWLWLLLAGPWLLTRRPGKALLIAWLLFFALIAWVVGRRAPAYLPALVGVAAVLLVALRCPPERWGRWRERLPLLGLALGGVWIVSLLGLQGRAEARVRADLGALGVAPVERLMVSPVPLDPGRWEVVLELPSHYRWGRLSLWDEAGGLVLAPAHIPRPPRARLAAVAATDADVRRFLVWARFPWLREDATGTWVLDARYARLARGGFGAMRAAD